MANSFIQINSNLYTYLTKANTLVISVAGVEPIEYREDYDFYSEVIKLIQDDGKLSTLHSRLFNRGYEVSETDLDRLLSDWKNRNILKDKVDIDADIHARGFEKYDRQIKNFGTLPNLTFRDGVKFQDRIAQTKIGIVGLGGVGSYVAYGLAAMGIGGLKLVEGDIVELSNTSRQILYLEQDVGEKKLVVARRKLKQISPTTETLGLDCFLSEDNSSKVGDFFSDVDLIIQCADTPRGEIEYIVDTVAHTIDKAWLTFAPYNFSKIFLGPLIIPGQTKSLHELVPKETFQEDKVIDQINAHFSPTIMDPYNGLAAKMALIEVMKFITGYETSAVINRRILLDTKRWEIETYDL